MTDALLRSGFNGMEVTNLTGNIGFKQRPHRARNVVREIEAMQRLAQAFAISPQNILRELAVISMELCGADSTGISLQEPAPTGGDQFRWIATSGIYDPYLGAVLPSHFSPCGTCLNREEPQLIRISKAYLDTIGVDAPPVTDGILIPWEVDATRGTIWAVSHSSYQLFDFEDFRILQGLADFAAIAVRNQFQRDILTRQAAAAATAAMANDLAHRINNPLQSLMNTVFLAGKGGADANFFASQAADDLLKLSALVKELLQRPTTYGPSPDSPPNSSPPAATSTDRY